MKELMTIETAAAFLDVAVSTIRKAISAGELVAYKRFGRWYILSEDLLTYIQAGDKSVKKKSADRSKD